MPWSDFFRRCDRDAVELNFSLVRLRVGPLLIGVGWKCGTEFCADSCQSQGNTMAETENTCVSGFQFFPGCVAKRSRL